MEYLTKLNADYRLAHSKWKFMTLFSVATDPKGQKQRPAFFLIEYRQWNVKVSLLI